MRKAIYLFFTIVFAVFGQGSDALSVSYDRYEYFGDSLVFYNVKLEYKPSEETRLAFKEANIPMAYYSYSCDVISPECFFENNAHGNDTLPPLTGSGSAFLNYCNKNIRTNFPKPMIFDRLVLNDLQNCKNLEFFEVRIKCRFNYMLPNGEFVSLEETSTSIRVLR